MTYTVRREGLAWVVRGPENQFHAARRTHAAAIEWADRLAKRRRRIEQQARLNAVLDRMAQDQYARLLTPAPLNRGENSR